MECYGISHKIHHIWNVMENAMKMDIVMECYGIFGDINKKLLTLRILNVVGRRIIYQWGFKL